MFFCFERPNDPTNAEIRLNLLSNKIEVGDDDTNDEELKRKFYLANVDAIVGPCSVVPDIGGAKNAHLQVKRRKDWAKLFVLWLEAPHEEDVMEFSEDEVSGEEDD